MRIRGHWFVQDRVAACEKAGPLREAEPRLTMCHCDPQPFRIDVPEHVLADLRERLDRTRYHVPLVDAGWAAGTDPNYLRELLAYWRQHYDWRKQEAALNRFAHFTTRIDDHTIHFIHQRGKGPAPLPLLLTHGYPDSCYRFHKLIPLLADPASHGGRPEDAFDVIAPDIPGYGFSSHSGREGTFATVPTLWVKLMTDCLGYERFFAHGGDWGSTITEQLARQYPQQVVAIQLTDVPFGHNFEDLSDLSSAEKAYLQKADAARAREGGYSAIQSTKPQSLAPGLNDSPVGLAAWIVEKFHGWSGCPENLDDRFTKDELLTHVMIYWITETIGSAFLAYYDFGQQLAKSREAAKALKAQTPPRLRVPALFAEFPHDLRHPPREWAERFFNVQRWTTMPRGGHFAAEEEPELLAEELRAAFRPFRS